MMAKIPKRLSKTPLPRYWRSICPEAISLWDISFAGCSIKTKVLLFDNVKLANKFTHRLFKYKMPDNCLGLFRELSVDVYSWKNGKPHHFHEYDKNYIGFIVLIVDHLRLEVIAHECCHAAIAYSRRLHKKWPDSDYNPDEHICYPLGKLVAQVCSAIKEDGYDIIGNHGICH
jgi:hypothetical protein